MKRRPVSWSEAALVSAACWVISGLGYGVLAALDQPQLSPAPLIGLGLARWFFLYHRSWRAAVMACFAGCAVVFPLADALRPDLGRYVADALATGTAYTVALAVFALFASPRARVSPDQKLPDQKLPDQKLREQKLREQKLRDHKLPDQEPSA